MSQIKAYSIFKRKRNGKKLPSYYCRFIYADGTEKTVSTKKTIKEAARGFADQYIKDEAEKTERLSLEAEKFLLQREREEIEAERLRLEDLRLKIEKELNIPTIAEYENFFIYGGRWCELKESRGISISKRHCLDRQSSYKNHIIPFWGEYRLSEIDAAKIAEFRIHLNKDKNLKGNTINKALGTLNEILTDGVLNKYIPSLPMIQRYSQKSAGKGILNTIEKVKLFPDDWEKVWCREVRETRTGPNRQDAELRDRDRIIYGINRFSYDTGARLGECQAIRVNKIDFKNMTVKIDSAHDNRCRITNERTKTGIIRTIPLTQKCIEIITELIKGRNENDYVFSIDGTRPLEAKAIQDGMQKALERIGISDTQRRELGISFHTYRYMYNSDMIQGGASVEETQKMTGHTTKSMTSHYLKISELDRLRDIIENRNSQKLKLISDKKEKAV